MFIIIPSVNMFTSIYHIVDTVVGIWNTPMNHIGKDSGHHGIYQSSHIVPLQISL
jgi:hypothetical protein